MENKQDLLDARWQAACTARFGFVSRYGEKIANGSTQVSSNLTKLSSLRGVGVRWRGDRTPPAFRLARNDVQFKTSHNKKGAA
jgi:hypothetical protein